MEPLVDTLWSSFRRVPPAAIPPMMDCILASTAASPSSLFSDLLKEFPNLTKDIVQKSEKMESEWRNCVAAYVAALSHLLKKSGANHIHMFVWKMWIPLLKFVHTNDHELFNKVTSLFLDVVTETDSWEVLEATMVPLLLRSIGLSMGMFQSEELAIYKWSENSISKGSMDKEVILKSSDDFHDKLTDELISEDFLESHFYDFPLSISCNILTLTLDAALQYKHEGVVSGSNSTNGCSAKVFAGNILWDLSNLTLQMLSQSLEHRSSAVRFLLPLIFKAFAQDYSFKVVVPGMPLVLTRKDFFMKIWKCCKLLFSMGSLERRDAYNILSLYLCFSSPTNEPEDVNVGGRVETFDLRVDQEFWDEIKRGLLDKESLLRKQSLHILKTTLNLTNERKSYSCILEEVSDERGSNSHIMSKRGRWADKEAQSLGVGKICNHDESSVTGWYRWEAFIFLYEILEEYGTHLVEAAWNHQIMLWLRSLENSVISNNEELYHNRMATAEQTFEWLAILWERGFCHDNPQVRCLIMQSFLEVEWESYGGCAKLVPKDFILGPLILGLNDPVHHREFGVNEVYFSWAIEAAARFLCQYVSYMEGRQHITFLIDLSVVPKTHSFGRAGLMCLVECIASAASGVLKHNNHETEQFMDVSTVEIVVEFVTNSCQIKRADLLDVLRFVLECSKQHFNSKYRHQVCVKIIAAAASVMTGIDIPLNMILHFISSVPREYTDYGGSLRYVVQNWLRSPNFEILKAINGFPRNFITYQHQVDSLFTYDDEELETWVSEAKSWARVLFLVVKGREHFDSILKFIEDHGADVCKQKNSLERVVVKIFILVSSMIEELHVIQGRAAMYQVTGKVNSDLVFPSVVDNLSFTEESIIFDKLATVLFSFLEELVSFTKLSCSVFWCGGVTEDMTLPGSIRGKLGGPSQRRLPSSLCTSVLEAITAIKTLASVLRWGAQFRRDGLTNSAQTFLWNFCWKIIITPAPKSEVEAEICIAAYEACAYALKDLVSVFSPLSLDIVVNNDILFSLESDGKALDVFVSTFIHNINNVIDEGSLARTRRAILMNWKWSCLESLLSLPNYALCNGVDLHMCKLYFSDTTVKQIFGDLVGSLENAGEVSVLSMLRSVRLSMELFDLKRMDPSISPCDGITIEMMWLLVNSSWILHISCNKRRVAPIAALLSSVLHYSVFGDGHMHEFNNAPGPLKWFVEKVLEEGTKSPRTIRLAALHLCGLWLAYPNTIKYYINELKLLTFYGSVAFDEDFEAELAENYDARTEVSVLSRSPDPELTDVFINTELYARVSVAVLFAKLADMTYLDKSTDRNENNFVVIASGKMFLLELLNSVVNDKDLSKELYKKYSAIHRRKVRAWQMICVLSRFVDLDIVEQVTSSLHTSIYRNNFPSVRQYLETFAIYIYLKFPSLVGQQLVSQLRNCDLRPQVNDKDLSKELYKKYSAIHRRKVRAWQMICVLSRFVDLDIVEQVTSSLHTSIYRNNFPSVRQYLETFAIYIYLKFPSLALSSYVFIAANVILNAKSETQFGHLDELLPPIVPLLTSHHHTLRGVTQILVYKVFEKLLPDSNSRACASMSVERRCFVDLKHYLAHNSDCARLRASMNSYLDSFDPLKSVSPAGIFTNRVKDLEFECIPKTLMDRIIDFLNDTREDLRCSMAKDAAAIKNESIQIEGGLRCSEILNSNGGQPVIQHEKQLLYDFQRKINFSKNEMQDSASTVFMDTKTSYGSLLDNMENEDQLLDQLLHSRGMIVEKLKSDRQQIILLASLVDRIPNLAGLARTCEVFRAAGLAIADKNILNDKQFQLISVTAEKWVPVVEVPVGSMKIFLEKKKQEGFAIIGLEQTANSLPLDQYKFSRKTVLILGREKEGIPVEIIHMLDACIEIPQLGVVRSLNVHVSGAIAIWEYTRQQRLVPNST